eukprot:scaffold6319_cov107-Isochrysis_galbana.AAC.9
MLAANEAPPVISATRRSRNGVASLPATPAASASLSAKSIAACTDPASASASAGIGTPMSMPEPRPSCELACTSSAASRGVSTRTGAAHPDRRVKKAGNSSAPKAATATPLVSSTSSVRGMSRIDLMPADTTHTGVRPSSVSLAAPVHATHTARHEDVDLGAVGEQHRGRDGGRAVASAGNHGSKVAARALGNSSGAQLRQPLELRRCQPNQAHAIEHGDGGRQGASVTDHLLYFPSGAEIVRIGHAVCDDRRFERHDRTARRNCGSHLRMEPKHVSCGRLDPVGSRAVQRTGAADWRVQKDAVPAASALDSPQAAKYHGQHERRHADRSHWTTHIHMKET